MKLNPKKLFFALLSLMAVLLAACGTPEPYKLEENSKLFCPVRYQPGVSECQVKVMSNDPLPAGYEELDGVFLNYDQVGVVKTSGEETYAKLEGMKFHPYPSKAVKIYSKNTMTIVASADNNEQKCGASWKVTCNDGLNNITLKGQAKFSSSFNLPFAFDFEREGNLRLFYEAGSYEELMKKANEKIRDTIKDSGDIDPASWLDGSLNYIKVGQIWDEKLKTKGYAFAEWPESALFVLGKFDVRYFEPIKAEGEVGAGSQAFAVNNEELQYIVNRDNACKDYRRGTSYRLECERSYDCAHGKNSCSFGSIIPVEGESLNDADTAPNAAPVEDSAATTPEVTPTATAKP